MVCANRWTSEANKAVENRSECVRRAVQERIERLRQGRFERLLAEAYQLSNEDPATDLQPAWTGPLPSARRAGPPTTGSGARARYRQFVFSESWQVGQVVVRNSMLSRS